MSKTTNKFSPEVLETAETLRLMQKFIDSVSPLRDQIARPRRAKLASIGRDFRQSALVRAA